MIFFFTCRRFLMDMDSSIRYFIFTWIEMITTKKAALLLKLCSALRHLGPCAKHVKRVNIGTF